MYIHIGNNNIINAENLIAIYNIESIEATPEYGFLIEGLKTAHTLVEENGIERKTLIITKEEDKIFGYFTNISSIAIANRAQNSIK